jgi:hypothetical protein
MDPATLIIHQLAMPNLILVVITEEVITEEVITEGVIIS